jgi:uncharacterized protein YndB with AHSA1/START domain
MKETVRITEWVDIEAPPEEVFELVISLDRRMQLSPLWGIAKVENPSHDYPQEGSSYDVEIPQKEGTCFETIVTAFKPLKKLAYKSIMETSAQVSWNLQHIQRGTRLVYTEEFLVDGDEDEEMRQSVQKVVKQWLTNIRRYAELRGAWTKRLARWLVDRFYMKLRPDQRKTVVAILYLQGISAVTFIMAAIALGVARLFS